jgi:hypothetical protein
MGYHVKKIHIFVCRSIAKELARTCVCKSYLAGRLPGFLTTIGHPNTLKIWLTDDVLCTLDMEW